MTNSTLTQAIRKLGMATAAVACFAALGQTPTEPVQAVAGEAAIASVPQSSTVTASGFPAKNVFWVRNELALPADIKTAGVYFDLENAPLYSKNFTERLAKAGYLVTDEASARYKFKMTIMVESEGRIAFGKTPVGSIVDGMTAGSGAAAIDPNAVSAATGRLDMVAFSAAMSAQLVASGLATRLMAGGNILEAIMKESGLGGKFNKWLTGDERGIVIGPRSQWSGMKVRLYSKELLDFGIGKTPLYAVAMLYSSKPWVGELIDLTVIEMNRYFGLVDAPEPNSPTKTTPKENLEVERNYKKVEE